jgi:hypothetical protein
LFVGELPEVVFVVGGPVGADMAEGEGDGTLKGLDMVACLLKKHLVTFWDSEFVSPFSSSLSASESLVSEELILKTVIKKKTEIIYSYTTTYCRAKQDLNTALTTVMY